MKALRLFMFTGALILIKVGTLPAQLCANWTDPVAVSDSLSDNRNVFLVKIPADGGSYFVFWERWTEEFGAEIVYSDFYNLNSPETVISGEGSTVSNPQVISVTSGYPYTDTLAFVFYQSNQSGNEDIFYTVMTDTGFTIPAPFATSTMDESHLSVSQGGGMVWQEGDAIRFCRLVQDNAGFHFGPVVSVDEGDCRNPVIQKTAYYTGEEYVAWEKGSPDNSQVWYSMWAWDNGEWSPPILLFDDGNHSNLRFCTGIDFSSWIPIMVSDFIDSTGLYRISGYDFTVQDELISEFSQPAAFQPDLFAIDIITQDFWQAGYLSFLHDEGADNSDIFSADYGELGPWIYNYCHIDSTAQPEVNPGLFQGAWYGDCFDLVCIWESWRNGHWQLFSSTTLVVVGNVPESAKEGDLNVRAFPNPFNGIFSLEVESVKPSSVHVTVFNTFGQPVKAVDADFSSAGENLINIETADLPAGIYLVRIETANAVKSLKMVKR